VRLTSYESKVLMALQAMVKDASINELVSVTGFGPQTVRRTAKMLTEKGVIVERPGLGWSMSDGEPEESPVELVVKRGDVIDERFSLLLGDAEIRLSGVPGDSVDVVVSSPPYFRARDYGASGQIGWEATPAMFAERLLGVLKQVARVLRRHGLAFVVFDDFKQRGRMACIDAMVEVGLDGVGLEKVHEITWFKPSAKPNGTDTSLAHVTEKVLVLRRKGCRHYWDAFMARQEARGGGLRRMTDHWSIPPITPNAGWGHHFAMFPKPLVKRCLEIAAPANGCCLKCGAPWVREFVRGESAFKRAGGRRCAPGLLAAREGKPREGDSRLEDGSWPDLTPSALEHKGWSPSCEHKAQKPVRATVLDMFSGAATTGDVAIELGHDYIGIDINKKCITIGAAILRKTVKAQLRKVRAAEPGKAQAAG
jgi:DNA modification methylase